MPQAGAASACPPSLGFLGYERKDSLDSLELGIGEIREQREEFGAGGGNPGRVRGATGKILWEKIPFLHFLSFSLEKGESFSMEGSFLGKSPEKLSSVGFFPFKRTSGMAIQGLNLEYSQFFMG